MAHRWKMAALAAVVGAAALSGCVSYRVVAVNDVPVPKRFNHDDAMAQRLMRSSAHWNTVANDAAAKLAGGLEHKQVMVAGQGNTLFEHEFSHLLENALVAHGVAVVEPGRTPGERRAGAGWRHGLVALHVQADLVDFDGWRQARWLGADDPIDNPVSPPAATVVPRHELVLTVRGVEANGYGSGFHDVDASYSEIFYIRDTDWALYQPAASHRVYQVQP